MAGEDQIMLSSVPNQQVTGDSTEEEDLLRRSKKKTKRRLAVREDDPMEMEAEGEATEMTSDNSAHVETSAQPTPVPKIPNNKFNKEGFTIWNNSRYGALEDLEESNEGEIQDEEDQYERPNGPTGTILSGKGKKPQVQITEAQISNDKRTYNKKTATWSKTVNNGGEGSSSTEKTKRNSRQAADTENYTVVRGYDNGKTVVRTVITEEGEIMEEAQTQETTGDHHSDPPLPTATEKPIEPGDPMCDVEFENSQHAAGQSAA
nr:uncharacterized protein LOC109158743 [Ipomoea batatas]